MTIDREKLNLTYPCTWEYKIIGHDEQQMRQAVGELVKHGHTLSASHSSRTGKYCSLRLEVTVPDEQVRLDLFEALRSHEAITFVL